MPFTPDNPCFGCRQTQLDGERVAPCCWDNQIIMGVIKAIQSFQGRPGVTIYSTSDEMEVKVVNNGPCPQLNLQTGACLIQGHKPASCESVEPYNHRICIKTDKKE